jgi:hypothetical protein
MRREGVDASMPVVVAPQSISHQYLWSQHQRAIDKIPKIAATHLLLRA